MAKDPAFLFYSKDYYEGTRMMLPEERACYVDLMIYQHQNGPIPNDPKRLTMYCSGCSEEMVNQVLDQKFRLTDKGWVSDKMKKVVKERSENRPKKIASATFAGLISTCGLKKLDKEKIKRKFNVDDLIYSGSELKEIEEIKNSVREWFNKMVDHLVDNKADVDANVNIIESKGKGGVGEKTEIDLPYDSENFKSNWEAWKEYKRKEHQFKYKTIQSEQAALSQLTNLARGEPEAIQIVQQSIANGWKGLFDLKSNNNEKRKPDPRFDDRKSKFEGASKRRGTVKFT